MTVDSLESTSGLPWTSYVHLRTSMLTSDFRWLLWPRRCGTLIRSNRHPSTSSTGRGTLGQDGRHPVGEL